MGRAQSQVRVASKGKSEMGDEETMLKCFHCGKKAADRIVQTEGANKDRKYFKWSNPMKPECTKFFKWVEQLQDGAEGDAVLCLCEDLAVKEVVKKEGKNKGRVFYHCGKPKADNCKFWEWGKKEEWVHLEEDKEKAKDDKEKAEDDKEKAEDDKKGTK